MGDSVDFDESSAILSEAFESILDGNDKEIEIDEEAYWVAKHLDRKRPRHSDIFKHGMEMIKKTDNKSRWWCGYCRKAGYNKLYLSSGTAHIERHLDQKHGISKSRTSTNSINQTEPMSKEHVNNFKQKLIVWMTAEHISYRQVGLNSRVNLLDRFIFDR
jgi:hypothetical protein